MSRRELALILALAVEDATANLRRPRHTGYRGHAFATAHERSAYRHYHRMARRAWRRVARQQLARRYEIHG